MSIPKVNLAVRENKIQGDSIEVKIGDNAVVDRIACRVLKKGSENKGWLNLLGFSEQTVQLYHGRITEYLGLSKTETVETDNRKIQVTVSNLKIFPWSRSQAEKLRSDLRILNLVNELAPQVGNNPEKMKALYKTLAKHDRSLTSTMDSEKKRYEVGKANFELRESFVRHHIWPIKEPSELLTTKTEVIPFDEKELVLTRDRNGNLVAGFMTSELKDKVARGESVCFYANDMLYLIKKEGDAKKPSYVTSPIRGTRESEITDETLIDLNNLKEGQEKVIDAWPDSFKIQKKDGTFLPLSTEKSRDGKITKLVDQLSSGFGKKLSFGEKKVLYESIQQKANLLSEDKAEVFDAYDKKILLSKAGDNLLAFPLTEELEEGTKDNKPFCFFQKGEYRYIRNAGTEDHPSYGVFSIRGLPENLQLTKETLDEINNLPEGQEKEIDAWPDSFKIKKQERGFEVLRAGNSRDEKVVKLVDQLASGFGKRLELKEKVTLYETIKAEDETLPCTFTFEGKEIILSTNEKGDLQASFKVTEETKHKETEGNAYLNPEFPPFAFSPDTLKAIESLNSSSEVNREETTPNIEEVGFIVNEDGSYCVATKTEKGWGGVLPVPVPKIEDIDELDTGDSFVISNNEGVGYAVLIEKFRDDEKGQNSYDLVELTRIPESFMNGTLKSTEITSPDGSVRYKITKAEDGEVTSEVLRRQIVQID